MLVMLSTLMILTAAAFAIIAAAMTVAGSWELIVAALNVPTVARVSINQPCRAGRRPIKVSLCAPSYRSSVAA